MGIVESRLSFAGLSLQTHRPHALHDSERDWPETNCYVDLWIELLAALGRDPVAALGFTAAQDFEGDQFTFFKFPPEDLFELYGLRVQELAVYDALDRHIAEQLGRGRPVLVEVDAYFLPDTRGVSYGVEHSKTTIAASRIDVDAKRMDYFHNAGYFALAGDDYDGCLQLASTTGLFPYVEFVKVGGADAHDPHRAALQLLRKHLAQAPQANPVEAFARRLGREFEAFLARDPAFFHKYAFNTLRQLGANFQLLGDHLAWLSRGCDIDAAQAIASCATISSGAKAFQFQLARAAARKRTLDAASALAECADAWNMAMGALRSKIV